MFPYCICSIFTEEPMSRYNWKKRIETLKMSVSHSLTLSLCVTVCLSLSLHHLHLFILGWRCTLSSFRAIEEAAASWWWRYRAANCVLPPLCSIATLWGWCSDLSLCGIRLSGPSAPFLRSCWLCGSCRCLAGGGCWACQPYQWQYSLSAAMWVYFCFCLIWSFLLFTAEGSYIYCFVVFFFCATHTKWLPESPRFNILMGQTEKAMTTIANIAKENNKPMPRGRLRFFKQVSPSWR